MASDQAVDRTLPQDERAPADKIKVFVSYSRQDAEFVAKIVDALAAQGDVHVFRDTDDILPTEEWKQRLANLISQADTIVFCLSPHSAASEVCKWEVEHAESLNKRIMPVVVEPIAHDDAPEELAKLNYIFFDSAEGFSSSLDSLVQSLHTDIGWIREHTRIGELARRWGSSKRRDDLLRGMALIEAEQWTRYRPGTAPELSADINTFIAASRAEVLRVQAAGLAEPCCRRCAICCWWTELVATRFLEREVHLALGDEVVGADSRRGSGKGRQPQIPLC